MVVIVIIVIIIVFLVEWSCNKAQIFSDGWNNNIYAIFAYVSFFFGAIYFWASSKSFDDYKLKERFMKLFEPENNLPEKSESNLPSKREINLSEVNLQSLVAELQNTLTSPTPIFFKGWGNRQLKLDVERAGLINEYIQNVIATGQSFIKLKADALISFEKIELLAKKELYELKSQADMAEGDYKLLNDKYEYTLTKLKTDTEKMKIEIENMRLQQEKDRAIIRQLNGIASQEEARAEQMRMTTQESKVRIELIKLATGETKFSELPQSYQTYILTTILNADANKLSDFDIRERIKDTLIQQAQAEADTKSAQAGGAKADTDFKIFKNEQSKKDAGV